MISSRLALSYRLDPEHYQPTNLELATTLIRSQPTKVQEFAWVTDGIHASPDWVDEGGVRHLSAKCVKDNYFVLTGAGQISQEQNRQNMRTHLRTGDVLLTTVGTIGNCAVVTEDVIPANIDRHVGLIRINRPQETDPYFVATFFNSRLGRFQTLRESTGNVQLNLFIEKTKELLVPINKPWINAVGQMTREAYSKRKQAESFYAEAEALLLTELRLDRLDLSHQATYTAQFSGAWGAGRLDAEYFQPKYESALEIMRQSGKVIRDVVHLAKRRFEPQAGEPFQYIEIGDLGQAGAVESQALSGQDAPSRAQWIVKTGDVITSAVRPIRRLSAIIQPEQDGFVCSSGFAVLEPASVEPEILLVYLRLPIICEIMDLYTSASMYPAISTTELLNLPMALASDDVRRQVVALVREFQEARREAHRLLEDAKRRVEAMVLGESAPGAAVS